MGPPFPAFAPRLIAASLLLIALLIASVVARDRSVRELFRATEEVSESHLVMRSLEQVLTDAVDTETGERGFLITGRDEYLEPYRAAARRMRGHLDELERLVAGNPEQAAAARVLGAKMIAKDDQLRETMEVYRARGADAARALVATGRSKSAMEDIRHHVEMMQQREQRRLDERAIRADRHYRTSTLMGLSTGILGVIGTLAFVWVVRRASRDQERAAADLFEESELLRVTLSSIGDGMIATDLSGRVTALNPIAEQLTGWTQHDALGRGVDQVFVVVNEQTRAKVENPVARAVRDGVIVGLANHTLLVARDGTERPIADSAAPIRSITGRTLGAVLVFRDVSEEREAQAALGSALSREQAWTERLRQLASASITINAAATADTIVGVIDAEARRILGAGRCSVVLDAATVPEEDEGSLVVGLHGRSGRRTGYIRCGDKAGGTFTEQDRAALTQLAQVAAIALENFALYNEIRRSDLRKDEFLATLAHELRNPLAPIASALEVLRGGGDGDQAARSRAIIERQVGQLVHLVDDLLDVSRVSRGKLELRRSRVPLSAVLAAALETSRPVVEAERHRIELTGPPEPVWLDADLTRLAQVFANLLNNSAKYMDPGGIITIDARADAHEVAVSVRDRGVGIAPEVLPHVFEMFVQADRSLGRSQGGLGIGLTLVRRLVELHNGSVMASSEGPGKGSEFVVRLPRAEPPETPAALESNDSAARPPSRRILVVDDNKDAVDSLTMLLTLIGQTVETARDGVEAIEKFARFEPDVVVLDIGLPGLNGYEVARRIREAEKGRHAVLVALTGWGQEEDRRRTIEAGFDHHLVKPVDFEALKALLGGIAR